MLINMVREVKGLKFHACKRSGQLRLQFLNLKVLFISSYSIALQDVIDKQKTIIKISREKRVSSLFTPRIFGSSEQTVAVYINDLVYFYLYGQ